MMEWLTAEAILNRPIDPVQFARDVIGVKLTERSGGDFRPEALTDWLRNTYTEASALVDEHGVIHGKVLEQASQSVPEQLQEMKTKTANMEKILEASKSISSLDPTEAANNITTSCCKILDCDRATMFTLDPIAQELLLWVAEGAKNIRVPLGEGIAGTVAATGETINIPDAYSDPRFSSSFDKATGYRTNTILCMPVYNADGGIAGVIQAINKKEGIFGSLDEDVLRMLAMQSGIALQNANHYHHAEEAQKKFKALLELIKSIQSEMGANSLIFTITQRTVKIVDADRCTLYLVDNIGKGLFAMQGEVNIRISMDQGIAGAVATNGILNNIPDAYEDTRFNQAIDKKSGYRTKAILCLPIKKEDGLVIGVLQLINKTDGTGVFTLEDEDIMTTFLNIAGPILGESQLYLQIQGKSRKEENELGGSVKRGTGVAGKMAGFDEDDEEEEES